VKSAGDVIDQQTKNGLPCALDQFNQLGAELRVGTVLLLCTIRLPCRETGVAPSCRLPWPFEWGNPTTNGDRDNTSEISPTSAHRDPPGLRSAPARLHHRTVVAQKVLLSELFMVVSSVMLKKMPAGSARPLFFENV